MRNAVTRSDSIQAQIAMLTDVFYGDVPLDVGRRRVFENKNATLRHES